MYGCMSVIHDVIQHYHYGTVKTFDELQIRFLHSKGNERKQVLTNIHD